MSDLSNLTHLSLAQIIKGLKAKDFTSVELTHSYLEAIENSKLLNTYVTVTAEDALAKAAESDTLLEKGEGRALEGVPLGIKDLFCTRGVHSQACSHILDGFTPPYESTVTNKLWDDGALMLGKLNMDEFAMGSSNETSYYGPAVNPWRRENDTTKMVAGGSSGGSASAVAARLCAGALGTDTGGSIRQPAAFTGTVGIKPTYGRCSRWGVIAFASSLDQAGPFGQTVEDTALLLRSMSGFDEKDSTSVDVDVPDFTANLGQSIKGMKIGIPKEYRVENMPDDLEELWQNGTQILREAGAEVVDISLPHTQYALPAYYIVAPAEASSNLARYDGVKYGLRIEGDSIDDMYELTRAKGFGNEVKRRIMIGTFVLSSGYYDAYYLHAQKIRTLIKNDFKKVYDDGIDAILAPTTPSSAFPLNDQSKRDAMDMQLSDVFTVTVNMAGLPGISVPAGFNRQGLPQGLQLIGQAFDETRLFQIAQVIEREAALNLMPENWWS